MAQDKTLKIGADTSQLGEGFNRIKQSAEGLARDIIRSSRAYSTSSREVTKDIDEQIRAIEKRNKLETEFRQQKLREDRDSGKLKGGDFKQQMSVIQKESQEDRTQTQLLREIIETLKEESKKEIRNDRLGVEQRIESSKRVDRLAPKGDEGEILKETLQRGMLGEVGQEEIEERDRFSYARKGLSVANRAGETAARSPNEFYALAAIVSMIPVVGGAVSGLTSRALGQANMLENSLEETARLKGRGIGTFGSESARLRGDDIYKMGLTPAEYYQKRSGILKSSGGYVDANMNMFAAERTLPMNQGQLGSLASNVRYGGGNINEIISSLDKFTTETGRNIALIPEYLDIYNKNLSQLATEGKLKDTTWATSTIRGVSEYFGVEGVNLDRHMSAFQRGLTQGGNPVIEALQYQTLSQLPGGKGKDMWDLGLMKEQGVYQPGYLKGFIENLESIPGGNTRMSRWAMKTAFPELSKRDIEGYYSGDKDISDLDKIIVEERKRGYKTDKDGKLLKDKDGLLKRDITDYTKGVSDFVGALEKSTKRIDTFFQERGVALIQTMDDAMKKISSLMDMIGDEGKQEAQRKKQVEATAEGTRRGMEEYYRNNPDKKQ